VPPITSGESQLPNHCSEEFCSIMQARRASRSPRSSCVMAEPDDLSVGTPTVCPNGLRHRGVAWQRAPAHRTGRLQPMVRGARRRWIVHRVHTGYVIRPARVRPVRRAQVLQTSRERGRRLLCSLGCADAVQICPHRGHVEAFAAVRLSTCREVRQGRWHALVDSQARAQACSA
jgi:hypothetical protein